MDTEPADLNLGDKPIFSERAMPGGYTTYAAAAAIGAGAIAAGIALDQGIVFAVGACILLVPVLLPFLETSFAISLNRQRLKVGRKAVIDVATIDRTYGIHKGEDVLDNDTLVSLVDRTDAMRYRNKRGDLTILGGAWGLPQNGANWVVLKQIDGTRYVMAVRNRDKLMDALDRVLAGR